MTQHFKTFGVIGAGAWGTAIAQMLAREGQTVHLWALEPEVAAAINTARENTAFLKGVPLKPEIRATNRLEDLGPADAIFAVAPAQHTRTTLRALRASLRPGTVSVPHLWGSSEAGSDSGEPFSGQLVSLDEGLQSINRMPVQTGLPLRVRPWQEA